MKKIGVLVFAALIFIPAAPTKADDAKKISPKEELKKLQGKWKLVSREMGGAESRIEGMYILIENDVWETVLNDRSRGKDKVTIVDPNADPKELDLKYNSSNQMRRGIYQFKDEDTLEVCFGPSLGDQKRPKIFTTKRDIGSGDMLYILKKEKK
jgi:uncharacterized protein (TIGR03067 family)